MTLQSHCWAYTQRKTWSERIHTPQCSLQHCLQLTRRGSNALMSINRKMDKKDVVHIHNGYYSAIKKDEIMPFAATWMDQECHTEWSKSDIGEISYDIPYMWNLKRNDTNELTYKTETHRLREQTYDCRSRGRKRRRDSKGVWDGCVHTAVFKVGYQQGPII